jgi:hypothetical protein
VNYTRLAATAKKLLTKHGQDVTLHVSPVGTYDPATGRTTETITDEVLKGALFDFAKGVTTVNGTQVESGDKELYLEAKSGVVPSVRDKVTVVGETFSVVSFGEINPAGAPVLYQLHLRR